MAQSHISRTVKILLEEKLIISERRRVANERKRVVAYRLTDKGINEIESLKKEMADRQILRRDEEGELAITTISELAPNEDVLVWADMLKHADAHDGMLLIEKSENDEDGELDLSSETITLLIELAELKMGQGQSQQAANDLRRAAILHRRRGNLLGQARCLLTAAGLDGILNDAKQVWGLMQTSGIASFSADEILTMWSNLQDEEMIDHCPFHIQQYIRCSKGLISVEEVPVTIDGNALQNVLWRAKRLSLQLDGGKEGVSESEILAVIQELSTGMASRPELVADIALKYGSQSALQAAWQLELQINTAGHVGFSLYRLTGNDSILKQLMELFSESGDEAGMEICRQLLS